MKTQKFPQRIIAPNSHALIHRLATRLTEVAREAIAERGEWSFVLAGGSTPKALFGLLASEEFRDQFDWSKTRILFGDERAVAPDDELSNYRMAREAMLDALPIPPENIHRMRGELEPLEDAAKEYGLLVQELGTTLDVCLMGMGLDGHTASLFPHSPQLQELKHRCVATPVASLQPHVRRLTLTYRTFNASRHVWVLSVGADKAPRLQQVLAGPYDAQEQPIQALKPEAGELVWWLDEAAASLL